MTASAQFDVALPAGPPLAWQRLARSSAKPVLGLALAALVVPVVASQRHYVDESFARFGSLDSAWVGIALAAEFLSMFAFARVQRLMLSASGSRVSTWRMTKLSYAATALSSTLPGGSAISVAYTARKMRTWGSTAPAAVFAVVASGVLSTTAFAVLVIARGVSAGDGSGLWAAIATVLTVAAICGVAPVRRTVVRWLLSGVRVTLATVGRVVHRPALADALTVFLHDLSRVQPSRRDWAAGFGYAEVNWLADLACLLACCQAVGATRVGLAAGTAAYLVGMTASSLSVLPGGLGAVEGAMIVVFASSNVNLLAATAAVVLYRVISMVLVVAVGWIAFGLMRRSDTVRGVDAEPRELAAEALSNGRALQGVRYDRAS